MMAMYQTKDFLQKLMKMKSLLLEAKKSKNKKSKKMLPGEPVTIKMSDINQTKGNHCFLTEINKRKNGHH